MADYWRYNHNTGAIEFFIVTTIGGVISALTTPPALTALLDKNGDVVDLDDLTTSDMSTFIEDAVTGQGVGYTYTLVAADIAALDLQSCVAVFSTDDTSVDGLNAENKATWRFSADITWIQAALGSKGILDDVTEDNAGTYRFTAPSLINTPASITAGQVKAQVEDALHDIRLDELIELPAGSAPASGSFMDGIPSAAENANAVGERVNPEDEDDRTYDELIAEAAAGNVDTEAIASATASAVVEQLGAAGNIAVVRTSVTLRGDITQIIRGDAHTIGNGRAFWFEVPSNLPYDITTAELYCGFSRKAINNDITIDNAGISLEERDGKQYIVIQLLSADTARLREEGDSLYEFFVEAWWLEGEEPTEDSPVTVLFGDVLKTIVF